MLKILLIFAVFCSGVFSQNISKNESLKLKNTAKNDEILKIGNGEAYILVRKNENAQDLSINQKPAKWVNHPSLKDHKLAIISAPYKAKRDIFIKNGDEIINLKLQKLPYKKEILKVAPQKINPPKSAYARIKKEFNEIKKIHASFTPNLLINGPFILPLHSKITSAYGTARVYNNELKSFHSGADFKTPTPQQISASNAGIVKIAKDLYYCGKSVIIDHGAGIYTQYCHLSKIFVKNGERVKKAQIIALSGASGRVSGPHLHFSVFANQTRIDPIKFIRNFNKIVFNK